MASVPHHELGSFSSDLALAEASSVEATLAEASPSESVSTIIVPIARRVPLTEIPVTFRRMLNAALWRVIGVMVDLKVSDPFLTRSQKDFEDSMYVKVLQREEPKPMGKSVVDIFTKEFRNDTADAESADPSFSDTTRATVKKSSNSSERSYQWFTFDGTALNVAEWFNLDAGLLTHGVPGGPAVSLSQVRTKEKSKIEGGVHEHSRFGFEYVQEETVCVPPGKKVYLTITTYRVKYEQTYHLEFSVPKASLINVTYAASCCCGLVCYTKRSPVPYLQMVRPLPGFREDRHYAYFRQEGKLTWIGESCSVEKQEESLVNM